LSRIAAIREVAGRLLPGHGATVVGRMRSGGSTEVYRLRRGSHVLFLRLAEQDGESMTAEAWVHGELRRLGAHVDHALCVIDRQEGGAELLAEEGIKLRALLTRADLA